MSRTCQACCVLTPFCPTRAGPAKASKPNAAKLDRRAPEHLGNGSPCRNKTHDSLILPRRAQCHDILLPRIHRDAFCSPLTRQIDATQGVTKYARGVVA
eukprot:1980547-Alexandrium_andersonii.AAC.1